MRHLTEEELALQFYGETADPEILRHLAGCAECSREYQRLGAILKAVTMPVPDRPPAYEREVWSRLRPRLEMLADEQAAGDAGAASVRKIPARRGFWHSFPGWVPVGAVAALVLAAFFLGRLWERRAPAPFAPANVQSARTNAIRDRVLLMAVGDHLDRTAAVLIELQNADPARTMDISLERSAAEQLLDDNRLYRQTALQVHDKVVADVLDQVERVLVDLSHQPSKISEDEFDDMRQRLQAQGILLKVRVVGSQVRERERAIRQSNGEKNKT